MCEVPMSNNGVLPLKEGCKSCLYWRVRKDSPLSGGGSSHIHSSRVTSPGMRHVIKEGMYPTPMDSLPRRTNCGMRIWQRQWRLHKKMQDVAVIFLGLPDSFESEGYDRDTMAMPECQNRLIAEGGKSTAQYGGEYCTMVPSRRTAREDDVAAILEMYLGGQGSRRGNRCIIVQ